MNCDFSSQWSSNCEAAESTCLIPTKRKTYTFTHLYMRARWLGTPDTCMHVAWTDSRGPGIAEVDTNASNDG